MASSSSVPGFNLPSGYRFLPTKQVLLGYYLLNKVLGKPFKCDPRVMIELNLYKEEPQDIWNRFGARLKEGEDLYVFTELTKKSENGSNVSRTTRSGTWKGDTTGKDVFDRSEDKKKKKRILGTWKRFHYMPNEPNETGSWNMIEYTLGDSLIPNSCRGRNLVLCGIRKDRKRKNQDQMNDSIERPPTKVARVEETHNVKPIVLPTKVARVEKTHNVMPFHGIKPILNDDNNLPASFTQFLATKQEQQHQELDSCKMFEKQQDPLLPSQLYQQQLLGNELMFPSDHWIFQSVGTYDPMSIVQPIPNADISHQPNNLGVPQFHDQQQQEEELVDDVLMVSNNHGNVQVNEHESYAMSSYGNQIFNEENNPMDSCFTQWLSRDEYQQQPQQQEVELNNKYEGQQPSVSIEQEEQLQQPQQEVEPNNMSEGQQSSVSFEHEEQQLQHQDQQLLPSTSHVHEQQQIPDNHLVASTDDEPSNPQPHSDSLTSEQPKIFGISTQIDEGQVNDYFKMNELFSGDLVNELSDSAALKFSSLDDDVFNGIDLDNLW